MARVTIYGPSGQTRRVEQRAWERIWKPAGWTRSKPVDNSGPAPVESTQQGATPENEE